MARWLESHPAVARVHYPGLASHPQHALAMKQQSGLGAAVVSFEVKGDSPEQLRAQAFAVLDAAQVCSRTTNLGDTKTTISHPATTSHGRLSEAQRQAAGIGQGLIRLAVGLDDVADITADLPKIQCPTLVITTEGSALGSVEVTRKWQETIPHSQLLVLPGDSYHVAASDADECAKATHDFIRKRAPAAA
mgnify:CR=1 FL=1